MKINLLRQKILDLAIRGKLVPQDPNDEPASVLLERIRAEKERLIAEGKIKRPKKSKATSSESHYQQFEPPFAIPESWEWVTVGTLLTNRDAERIPVSSAIRKKQINKIYDYYGAAGIIDKVENYLFNEKLLLVGEDGANLLSRAKDNAFLAEGKYWVNNHAHILDCLDKSILEYVAYVINSYDLESYITGSAQPKLSQDNLNRIPIPLPPLSEQQRIVSEIETCLMLIDQIEGNRSDLQTAVINTKSKILTLAMQGKLVPQDLSDEPAADMLRRINPKAKIITDNPHYWNIPKSWCWCQLGDIFKHNTGKALNSSNKDGIAYEYITTSNVYWGKFELHSLKKMLFKDNEIDKCLVKKGDLLICEGGDVGRAAVWDLDTTIMIQNHLHRLRPYSERISAKLYCIFMKAFKDKQLIGGKGIALQGFSSNALHKLIMPLPPASEQKRILAKIEELFSVLDSIEASLQS